MNYDYIDEKEIIKRINLLYKIVNDSDFSQKIKNIKTRHELLELVQDVVLILEGEK